MDIRAAEISAILKQQIANFWYRSRSRRGRPGSSVGDGTPAPRPRQRQGRRDGRVPWRHQGMALNLERDKSARRDLRRRPHHPRRRHRRVPAPSSTLVGKGLLGRVVDGLATRSTAI